MTNNEQVTLFWPEEKVYMDWACPWWPRWFEIGARRLGWDIMYSPTMSKHSEVGRPRYCITVAEIEVNGKRTKCFFDWTDWRAHRFDLQKPGDIYFSVDLPFEDGGEDRYPIGNPPIPRGIGTRTFVAGDKQFNSMYEQHLPRLRAMRQRCIETGKWENDVLYCVRAGSVGVRGRAAGIILEEADKRGWKVDVRVGTFNGVENDVADSVPTTLMGIVEHWEAQAKSKVSVALPGCGRTVHQDWSWRHTEVTGMGCSVVTLQPISVHPGCTPWWRCDRELVGFADTLQKAMDHDQSVNYTLCTEYYDEFLSPEAQCKYVLECIGNSQRWDNQ